LFFLVKGTSRNMKAGSPTVSVRRWRRVAVLSAVVAVAMLSSTVGVVSGQDSRWVQMTPSPVPPSKVGHAMTYDSGSDHIILFGGETAPLSNVLNDESWAYDLNSNTWENRNPSPRPSARFAHAMAYDSESNRTILYGGWTGTEQSTETWAYSFDTNTWTNMTPATSPSAGVFAHMAYDAQSDRIIRFGGGTDRSGGLSDETWAYNFNSNTWTLMNPATSASPRQTFGMMAYDTESDRIVLFGGLDTQNSLADTWAYKYNNDAWTQMSPGTGPSRRHAGAMAYDARTDSVILFGGHDGAASDETWVYDVDGDTWTLAGGGSGPSSRFGTTMAYDAESETVVLFGGSPGGDETWSHRFVSPEPVPWAYIAVGVALGAVAAVALALLIRRRRGKTGT